MMFFKVKFNSREDYVVHQIKNEICLNDGVRKGEKYG